MMTGSRPVPGRAYISLGTNMGDRLANLRRSLRALEEEAGPAAGGVSPVYETDPVGGPPQGKYLNACAAIDTALTPTALLVRMLEIENRMGRVRTGHWGPRIIDLDLLVHGPVIMKTPLLTLPHPLLSERPFVLLPLSDIAPDLIVPGTNRSVAALKEALPSYRGVLRCPLPVR